MKNYKPIHILLSMIDPSFEHNIDISKRLKDERIFSQTMRLAKDNGLYYQFIKQLNKDEILKLDKRYWKKEKERLSDYKKTINLLNSLKKNNITYAVVKDSSQIPHIPRDVDIFVPDAEKEKAIKNLKKEGLECEESSNVETVLKKGENIKVDVYTKIGYFGHEFLEGDFLLHSIKENELFGIKYNDLNHETNFLLMIAHSLFGHGSITLLDFLHLRKLRNMISDPQKCKKYAVERNWGFAYDNFLKKIDSLSEMIYEDHQSVKFPYTFNIRFRLNCLKKIDDLNFGYKRKSLLYISFTLDKLLSGKLQNTYLYDTIKSIDPLRKTINEISHNIKNKRGDKMS